MLISVDLVQDDMGGQLRNGEQIQQFEKSEKQLHVFLKEMGELSKKSPNGPVNKFKLDFINKVLVALNEILGQDKPFAEFVTFDSDQLPSNSDVRFILAQYASSVYSFRLKETGTDDNFHFCWIVGGKLSKFNAGNPESFRYPL